MYKDQKLAIKIIDCLKDHYKNPKVALNYANAFQLLVATILSAQCTDDRVNLVTPMLFKKYPNVKSFAKAKQEELETEIKSCGFYRNKAKSIIEASKKIENEFSGKVPDNMTDLLSLRGVARKTANIILSSCFKKAEGIAVDTHVARLSKRFFFSLEENPNKIEQDLMTIFDKKDWILANYLLVEHGRHICKAIKPSCDKCFLTEICPVFNSIKEKRPYITIKYAQSLDGKIATRAGDSKWISNEKARKFVHELRAANHAILVGINTVLTDDPMLDVRLVKGKNPVRIILDSDLRIPLNSKIVKTAKNIRTIIFTKRVDFQKIENIEIIQEIDLQKISVILKKKGITRLLVEGGGKIISSFLKENLVDCMFIVIAPILIGGDGISAVGDLGVENIEKSIQMEKSGEFNFDDNIVLRLNSKYNKL